MKALADMTDLELFALRGQMPQGGSTASLIERERKGQLAKPWTSGGDTRTFQQYDRSNPAAQAQLQPAFNALADPIKATLDSDPAAQERITRKVAQNFLDPLAAGTFAGVGAKLADLAKLKQAEKMIAGLERGTPEFMAADRAAWEATGWTHGFPDGKPRFEISDHAMQSRDYQLTPQKGREKAGIDALIDGRDFLYDRVRSMEPYRNMSVNQLKDEYKRTGGEIVDAAMKGDTKTAEALNEQRAGLYALLDSMRTNYGPMSAFVKHGELGQQYPDVYKMHVRINPEDLGSSRGQYIRGNHVQREQINLAERPDWRASRSTLLHEGQHAIQEREGFARGGNPDNLRPIDLTKKELSDLNNKQYELLQSNPEFYKSVTQANQAMIKVTDKYGKISKADTTDPIVKDWWEKIDKRDSFPESSEYFNLKQKEHYITRDGGTIISPDEQYRRLAGEAEARLTQQRMNLTPAERLQQYPVDQFDVPVSQQIVRFQEGLK